MRKGRDDRGLISCLVQAMQGRNAAYVCRDGAHQGKLFKRLKELAKQLGLLHRVERKRHMVHVTHAGAVGSVTVACVDDLMDGQK